MQELEEFMTLDDSGFIKEGEHITDEDVIMGKCSKIVDSKGKEITKVFGERVKYGTYGVVDKVVVTKIPFSCTFSPGSKVLILPSLSRTIITDNSLSKLITSSAIDGKSFLPRK